MVGGRQYYSTTKLTRSPILLTLITLTSFIFIYYFTFTTHTSTSPNPKPNPNIQYSFVNSLELFLSQTNLHHLPKDDTADPTAEHSPEKSDQLTWRSENARLYNDGRLFGEPVRVYVYEMPVKFTYDLLRLFRDTFRETVNLTSNGSPVHRLIEQHSVDYWLWADLIAPESERLLKSVVRVHRQEDADLFYVPFFTTISYFLLEKQQCKTLYREALKWVTDQPAWKRSEGRDHIFPIHHPWSFKTVRKFVKKAIWLLPDMDSTGNWYKPGQVSLEKDLILPYVPNLDLCDAKCLSESASKRTTLLYFRGRLKRNAGGKIRSKLGSELGDADGVVIEEGSAGEAGKIAAQSGMRKSVFCLSPAGDTPSSARLFDAIVSGCIPVIVSDELELPFEGILDYRKIALFVSSSDAVQPGWLLAHLRSIKSTQIKEMQDNLAKYVRHFLYSHPAQPLGPEDLVWRMMAGKQINIKLHTRRSQRVVKESRIISPIWMNKSSSISSLSFESNGSSYYSSHDDYLSKTPDTLNVEYDDERTKKWDSECSKDLPKSLKLMMIQDCGARVSVVIGADKKCHVSKWEYEDLPFTKKDCRNYIDKVKRLKFRKGDAEAIQGYFMKMQGVGRLMRNLGTLSHSIQQKIRAPKGLLLLVEKLETYKEKVLIKHGSDKSINLVGDIDLWLDCSGGKVKGRTFGTSSLLLTMSGTLEVNMVWLDQCLARLLSYCLFNLALWMDWMQCLKMVSVNLLILKKWHPDVNLMKVDVGNVPVWVKLHGVPVTAFREDGLSAIATKLGTPLIIDSYTSDMFMQSWGRSSYARAMIELRADVELKDNIVECPKNIGADETKNLKKPSQTPRGVPVGQKVGFKSAKQVYQPISKKTTANTSGPKNKNMEPTKEVSKSNPFDVLTPVENDVVLGTNGGTSNLASQEVNSSGSSFWNVNSSSPSTTSIIEKIDKIEKLIIDGKVTLVDDEGKPLEKVESSGDYDSEDGVASVDNEMASFLAKNDAYGTNSLLEQWKKCYENVIMEYLVNISKRRAFWSLNEDILKITILKTKTPYPSRKIRRIRAYTHQRPQRKEDQYAVSRKSQYAILEI
ncbi:probable arabinosyltransferase ARAD1 [Tanacetum coccineum]|uniref:Probable arabinosyltransferase ARAD1 n=1 Tax=Tanacetum coccineum TaxID=301880 RepID=A0ABQ5ANJ4_9ASTR